MRLANFEPADIEIYARGHGVVLKEKALLVVSHRGGMRVDAVGNAAAGKNFPEGAVQISPLHQGRVYDLEAAEYMFREFLRITYERTGMTGFLKKPVIGVCVMSRLNQVELKAYRDLFLAAGAREVTMLKQTLQEFLALVPEAEQRKYELIVSVSKDDPHAYVREKVSETMAYASRYGYNNEQLIEMIKEIKKAPHGF